MLNKPRLLAPGPTPVPGRVRLAMAQDMIHHRKPAFKNIMAAVQERLQTLFGTTQPVMPLACSGTGAMTAAVSCLFNSGEKVITIEGGKFGERWGEIARTNNLTVETISVEWGKAVAVDAVTDLLDAHPDTKGVLIQLSETSTGVLHPVQELAAALQKRDVLLVVDGISAVGISPCPMDEWGIDCLLTGSQKGLMVPPGLALVALSDAAWAKAEKVQPASFYFNLLAEREKVRNQQTLFTSPVSLLIGLEESLRMIEETGYEALFRKQWALTQMCRAGVSAMGLSLFAEERFTWGLTSVQLPDGVDGVELLNIASERFGTILAGGQAHMKGKMVRIGHMGWVDWADLSAGLHAVAESYRQCGGYIGSRDYMEKALQAYHDALDCQWKTLMMHA